MKVPFMDLWRMHEPLKEEFYQSFQNILGRNAFVKGPELTNFESDFSKMEM